MNSNSQVSETGSPGAPRPKPRLSPLRKVWRVLRILIFVAVCLATLLFLINAEENWRAGRLWKQCRLELEKRGEKLDVKDFLPAPAPPDQNFAATPLLAAVLTQNNPKNPVDYRLGREANPPGNGSWRLRKLTDWQAWCDYYGSPSDSAAGPQPPTAAAGVLRALSRLDGSLAELRAAAERPQAQLPVHLDVELPGMFLPYVALAKGISQTMALHAMAAAATGRGAEALSDLKVNWRLLEALKSEPVLITFLVRIAVHELTLQPLWEGLAARCWDEPQLAALDRELGRLDFLAEAAQALRGERAFMNATLEQMMRKPPQVRRALRRAEAGGEPSGSMSPLVLTLFPRWMIYRNQALATRFQQDMIDHLEKAWREPETTSALDMSMTNRWNREFRKTSPNNFLAKLLMPALSAGPAKAVRAQTTLNLARTACALERYRLAHGAYPDKLDPLVPQFLPKAPLDPYAGRPLHYRPEPNGRFLLYSVGSNQTDEGGVAARKPDGGAAPDQGDWVWAYP